MPVYSNYILHRISMTSPSFQFHLLTGGLGSFGGTGFRCAMRESCSTNLFDPMNPSCHTSCENDGATGRARRGGRGDGGKDGKS